MAVLHAAHRQRPKLLAVLVAAKRLSVLAEVQRLWQDLVEEYGYGASYERFVRTLAPTRRAVGVFHCAPGEEG